MKNKIRVGIFLYSTEIDVWIYETIKPLIDSEYASIDLIVLDDRKPVKSNFFAKVKNNLPSLFYKLYEKLDAKLFGTQNNAFATKDISNLIGSVSTVKVEPIQKRFFDYFSKEDVDEIKSHSIDVFLRFGFNILKGDVLNCAKYGIWSYHHGDNGVNRGGPAGFWELKNNEPQTGSVLQVLSEDLDNGAILKKTFVATDQISLNRNRNKIYWESVPAMSIKIKELYEIGADKFFDKSSNALDALTFYDNRLYKTPSNGAMLSFVFSKWSSFLVTKIRNLFYWNQWVLLYSLKDKSNSYSFWRYKRIDAPKNRFYADPHVLYKEGKYYLYLEEYLYEKSKGIISCIEIDEKGKCGKTVPIIEKDYHLSYPFVFEKDGDQYMIPETSDNRSVEVYKCTEFPYKWEFYKFLQQDFEACDVTPLLHDGTWWFFATHKNFDHNSSEDHLYLYYADDIFSGDWNSHPSNPIKSDIRGARPAGKILELDNKLYRPAQNGTNHYGYGFKMFEIEVLNKTEYKEVEVSSIEPNWDNKIKGTHTFNRTKDLTVIDALYRRSKF